MTPECPAQLPSEDPQCPYADGACPIHRPKTEREQVVEFIRQCARDARKMANQYRQEGESKEARVFSKIDEALGRVANRVERGEHVLPPK